jgi:hypothetical protein
MGMFSFQTADTKESIFNCYSDRCKTVYLLQPNDEPIVEFAYGGNGIFGGVNVYSWLAEKNVGVANDTVGLTLSHDEMLYLDEKHYALSGYGSDKDVQSLLKNLLSPKYGKIIFFSEWDEIIEGTDKTPNELLDDKLGKNIMLNKEIKFPLKFSFNQLAKYDELEASKDCPYQGHFY